MINVKYEDAKTIAEWGGITEKCFFCKKPTRYWHELTNNPVCPDCGKTHKVIELPDFGQRIRARKRLLARKKKM